MIVDGKFVHTWNWIHDILITIASLIPHWFYSTFTLRDVLLIVLFIRWLNILNVFESLSISEPTMQQSGALYLSIAKIRI